MRRPPRNPKAPHGHLPRSARRDTALAAGWNVSAEQVCAQQRRIVELLRARGPLTDEEQQAALGMNPNSHRPRRRELESRGLVRDSGLRRPTRSGKLAIAWAATAAALADRAAGLRELLPDPSSAARRTPTTVPTPVTATSAAPFVGPLGGAESSRRLQTAPVPFDDWLLRPDVDGHMGCESPTVPESSRWWARFQFEDLPRSPLAALEASSVPPPATAAT